MSNLEPIDNGVRRFRPGLIMVLCALVLTVGGWIVFQKVSEKQRMARAETKAPIGEEEIRKIREAPTPPSTHPLEGKRRLFLADGCRYRFQEFTFTRDFSEQHEHPGIVIRDNDPTLWNFVAIPEKAHAYRIFCADPNFPNLHGHNLTYTRVYDDEVQQDDLPPYLTLRSDDHCEWKAHQLPQQDQYELFCLSGSAPFIGESLGWTDEQDDLSGEYVTATLGENGRPSWWILPEGKSPTLPRRASHLLVMNRGDITDLEESRKNFTAEGHGIFQVQLKTEEDKFVRAAKDLSYVNLVKAIRNSDPIIRHPDFPPLLGISPTDLITGELNPERLDPLFPLIIPLKLALHPHLIQELTMENTEFWINKWEALDDFQSHLDESDAADGRVYHGKLFTYIFVSWDQ